MRLPKLRMGPESPTHAPNHMYWESLDSPFPRTGPFPESETEYLFNKKKQLSVFQT